MEYKALVVGLGVSGKASAELLLRKGYAVTGADRQSAIAALKLSGKSVPIALIMLMAKVDRAEAVERLRATHGNVRQAIEGDP